MPPPFVPNNTLTLTLSQSTVSHNTVGGDEFQVGNGGGVYIVNGLATIVNSTLSGNQANGTGDTSGFGGGVATFGLRGAAGATLINSTIADNSAVTGGGGVANFRVILSTSTTFENTIVAGNSAPNGASCFNDSGTLISQGHNLEDNNTCNFTAPTDLPNTNPLLALLADNGGATQTHALLPGSPAIDAGSNPTCNAAPVNGVDQRGVARPQGPSCDIGAYEAQWAATVLTLDYQYQMNDSSAGTGTYALLADGAYVDERGQTGTWLFQSGPPRLILQYNSGFACEALSVGRFVSSTQVRGPRTCQDGSGVSGFWIGTIASGSGSSLPQMP
jgi:hypothetical protein